ncbi:MAG: bifunctional lysylphosphatidylglycerol flippase/synthetase MprF [Candidatus Aminicenantes bacterium]|nr:bifunctional lysylphosphatidylglycerol flippase/synthetase MprF [Candidatus Aminicenantes bacterium]
MDTSINQAIETGKLKNKITSWLPPAIGIVFFVLAAVVLHNELKQFHYHEIIASLEQVHIGRIFAALFFTLMSYLALTLNEALLFKHFKHPLPYRKTALVSFVSTTISHNIGYSVVTGGSLRYRFYSTMDVSTTEISSFIGLHALFFWLGFFLSGGILFIIEPLPIPDAIHLPFTTLLPLAIVFLSAIALFYIAVFTKFSLKIHTLKVAAPAFNLSTSIILVSAIDWVFSGLALYVLLPPAFEKSVPLFLGIYLLAQIAGVSSQVPGGLGVFETLLLVMIGAGPQSPGVMAALLVFRIVYYWIPLLISAVLLGIEELLLTRLEIIKRTSLWVGRFFSGLAPNVFAFTTFLGGVLLLFSGATPAVGSRMAWLIDFLPLPVIEFSHFMGSLVGMGLLFLAYGLQRRLDAAYRLTIGLFVAGIIFSLFKGFDYEEAIVLFIMLIALLPSRKFFYRKTLLTSITFSAPWIAAIGIVILSSVMLGIFAYKHINYSHDLWWQFAFFGDAPRTLRAMVGVLTLAGLLGLRRLLRPAPAMPKIQEETEFAKVLAVIRNSNESIAQLALLKDKSFLISDDEKAFIMFGVEGRSWVAMGDPLGAEDSKPELLWKFLELVDRHNGWPVFYEVSSTNLHLYVDMGLTLSKLGEEARTKLETFKLEGKSYKHFRHIINHLEAEGYTFEIIAASSVFNILPQLKGVSDDWLAKKRTREKGFSQGFFKEEYLVRFPMALVKKEDKIEAFANLWATDNKEELSVDLMRYSSEAPDGTMDYLFIKLMLWGKEQQYRWFNLGMAPLSGVENRHLAPLWYKLGAFIFKYGENFYNFRGLRQYKEKFDPEWEPKYLASPGGLAIPRILTNLSSLTSRGFKGIIYK